MFEVDKMFTSDVLGCGKSAWWDCIPPTRPGFRFWSKRKNHLPLTGKLRSNVTQLSYLRKVPDCYKWMKVSFPVVFAAYNQQDAKFHNLFISVRRSTCFRRFFLPSSVAQNCTYSVRYWSDKYLTLYVQFWATDDGRKNRLKHVERLTEINKFWNFASCWL